MIQQLVTIALNGFREASRNRVTVVVAAFALVLIFSSTIALEFTVSTFDRVMTDVGLGVMSLISVGLTMFLGTGLIPREIERRTIFLVVSRPVSRPVFVVGRLLGNVLTIYVLTLVMAAILAAQFFFASSEFTASLQIAIFGLLLEVTLLSAVAIFFSTWSSQTVSVVCSIGLYFLGHAAGELYRMASKSASAVVSTVGKAVYYLVPNLDRLDFKPQATYGELVSGGELLGASLYTLAYVAVLTILAGVIFQRRDFK